MQSGKAIRNEGIYVDIPVVVDHAPVKEALAESLKALVGNDKRKYHFSSMDNSDFKFVFL